MTANHRAIVAKYLSRYLTSQKENSSLCHKKEKMSDTNNTKAWRILGAVVCCENWWLLASVLSYRKSIS